MRNGFKSSRGAMRGTIGGAPICLVGVVGFATVAIGIGPFVCSIYSITSAFTWPHFKTSRDRLCGQPFAATFLVLSAYASRHAREQKWKSSPSSRNGMESVSSTCIPQIGSRTRRRPNGPPSRGVLVSRDVCPRVVALRNIQPTKLRRSHAAQEATSNQNRNRTKRARKVIQIFVLLGLR